MPETVRQLQQRLSTELVEQLINPIQRAGGTGQDILILMEVVCSAVIALIVAEKSDETAVKVLAERVRARVKRNRLAIRPVAGHA